MTLRGKPLPFRFEPHAPKPRPDKFPGSDAEWAEADRKAHSRRMEQAREKHVAQDERARTVDPNTVRRVPLREHIDRNQVANAVVSAGIGTGGLVALRRRQKVNKLDDQGKRVAAGAAAGMALTDAVYVVGGQSTKAYLKHKRGLMGETPREQDAWAQHKQKHGLKPGEEPTGHTPAKVKHNIYTKYPTELPGWRAQRALGWKNSGRVYTAALLAGGTLGANRGRKSVDKALKATEFEAGNRHEQYSGEGARRKIAAAGLGYAGVAGAAALGTTGLALHRHAGRPQAQAGLRAYEATGKNPALVDSARKLRLRAAKVAARPKTTAGAMAGLAVTATGAGTLARFRRNEEAGISQGVGRIKAGSQYDTDLRRIGKSLSTTTALLSTLASDPTVRRAGKKALEHKRALTIGSSLLAGTGATAYGARAGGRRAKEVQATRVALGKGAGLRWAAGIVAAGGAGGAAAQASTNDKRKTAAGLAGAGAGQGLYQGIGYKAKHLADAKTPRHQLLTTIDAETKRRRTMRRSDMTSTEERKAFDRHSDERRAHYAEYQDPVSRHRNTPSHWAGAKTRRVIGWTHGGKTGTALGTAATIGGGEAAMRLVPSKKSKVGKSREYGYRERTVAPLRVAEGAAGASLLAWGGSRLPLSGVAAYGQRLAERHGGGKEAAAALELARSLGSKTRSVTGHGEQLVRGARSLDRAIERVPANLRPSVAVVAGALLVARSRPLHNERFVPEGRLR